MQCIGLQAVMPQQYALQTVLHTGHNQITNMLSEKHYLRNEEYLAESHFAENKHTLIY